MLHYMQTIYACWIHVYYVSWLSSNVRDMCTHVADYDIYALFLHVVSVMDNNINNNSKHFVDHRSSQWTFNLFSMGKYLWYSVLHIYIDYGTVLLFIESYSDKYNTLYWCVAYLPSEASIIEHWTYTFHYLISYTFLKQCETLNAS
jgi:hypothetical protein